MANTGMEFKVRVWSNSNKRTFDVVALDHDNNKQHYQPGVEFSTETGAEDHKNALVKILSENPERVKFIRDCWPVDGGIE